MNKDKTSTIKGLEQGRAQYAYDSVKEYPDKEKYKAYIKKVPMLIKTNGLGATLAYLKAKSVGKEDKKGIDKKTYESIYNHFSEWIKKDEKHLLDIENKDLVEELIKQDSPTYRAVTVEILALCKWLCRFAEGFEIKEKLHDEV